jgi:putative redox protein
MMSIKMDWAGGLKFKGISTFGHDIMTDAGLASGGDEAGYKPSELLLFGLAGCTGMDVIRILEKQKQDVTALEVEVTGHQDEKNYPRPFHTVEVKFRVHGRNIDREKLARAIELSEQKYCMVGQTIKNAGKVVTSYEILPA